MKNRPRLLIKPMGAINPSLTKYACMKTRDILGIDIVLLKKEKFPLNVGLGESACSTDLLKILVDKLDRHRENDLMIGIVDRDVKNPIFSYVFGEALPARRVAVVALKRLKEDFYGRTADLEALESRLIKVIVHEFGHLMGLRHCMDSSCLMSWASIVEELDAKSPSLCSLCHTRIDLAIHSWEPLPAHERPAHSLIQ